MQPQTTIPLGFCQCGCGQTTTISPYDHAKYGWIKGQPRRYALGHNRRTKKQGYVVDPVTGCWGWTGYIGPGGYGRASRNGKAIQAHRMFFEDRYGPLPPGMEPDHLCRNRRCVNPDHMEAVTRQVNAQRGSRAKLTPETVRWIRQSLAHMGVREIARHLGVSHTAVMGVRDGRHWQNVE